MKFKFNLDKIGLAASLICAVHCAFLPLIIGILPLIGMGFMAHGLFDWVMVGIAAIVGLVSIMKGHQTHKKHTPACFFIPGIFIILISLFVASHFGECHTCAGHDHDEFPFHSIMMAIGGVLIAVSHFINMKLCKSCTSCSEACSKD